MDKEQLSLYGIIALDENDTPILLDEYIRFGCTNEFIAINKDKIDIIDITSNKKISIIDVESNINNYISTKGSIIRDNLRRIV